MSLELNDIFVDCVKLSNAYRNKHKELQEVFKAYKNLKDTCDTETLNQMLLDISDNINSKIISKEKLNSMIDEQNNVMSELSKIRKEILKVYPDFNQ